MRQLRVAMAQINTTIGDFNGNLKKISGAIETARAQQADIIAFPELAVCGYPPEDLLFKPQFVQANLDTLKQVAPATRGICAIVGFVDQPGGLYNAAAVCHNGEITAVYHKILLPNYGVFDEERYFHAGTDCPIYVIKGVKIGVNICEDIWYDIGPATVQAYHGAEVLINISASPYHVHKGTDREKMIAKRAADTAAAIFYVNAVGGQDELVFDGHSIATNAYGKLLTRGKQFEEDMVIVDIDADEIRNRRHSTPPWNKEVLIPKHQNWTHTETTISGAPNTAAKSPIKSKPVEPLSIPGEVYTALVVGTRDYVKKNGFKKVVIGLSGGIDSAIVATIAVDALGKENVIGVNMPSRFSSTGSVTDTEALAHNLGIKLLAMPIEKPYQAYLETLAESFTGKKPDTTEENLQARVRGNLLMALSNKFGWLVLTTGNKSEMATGYTTLYGDMAGGFAVIKDVPKTLVYQIARYRNELAKSQLIPEAIFTKPPSAELRPDQKDVDSLPPYEILDPILQAYVEDDKSVAQIIKMGYDEAYVRKAAKLVDMSESRASVVSLAHQSISLGLSFLQAVLKLFFHIIPFPLS
ncbi:MAG: NAD+ synthase [Dehalococcoidales bacterium]|nr:NAD+ synthase [Dehalococcoidales bacterium]